MIFQALTKALEELEIVIGKIKDLHYPSDSKSDKTWEWMSDAHKQIETGGEHEDVKLSHKEELKRIEKHIKEAQRIYEKIESEYQSVRLSIELAMIASYLSLLFPSSEFFASLAKKGRNAAKEIQDRGSIWYNHLEPLEDEIIEERENFTAIYL